MATEQVRVLGEAELGAIVASAMDAVIVIDQDQRIVLFNPAAESMFGCPRADALGSTIDRFLPVRYRIEHSEHVRQFHDSGRGTRPMATQGEAWGLRANGEEFPVEASITAIPSERRGLSSIFLRASTTRHAAQTECRDSQRMLSTLVESLFGMAYRCLNDSAWTMQYVSEHCRLLTGYGRQALIGGKPAYGDLIHPDDRERVWEETQDAIGRGSPFKLAYRIRRKDGALRWISERGAGVRHRGSPDVRFLEGIITDVTEAREAEEQIRESERRFRAALNQRTQLVAFITPDGVLEHANERALAMIGADPGDVIGRRLWETPWWDHDPALQKKLQRAIAQAAAGESARFEAVHPRADGAMVVIDFSLTPITTEDGGVEMLLAEGVDITDRRRMERALEEREELASIAVLMAGIAHDIGAPMTAILAYAEMMEKSLPDGKNRRRAGLVVEQVSRINKLVRSLLGLARPDDHVVEKVNMLQVVGRSLEFCRSMLHTRGVRIERSLTAVPTIAGDPHRLQQALLNLIMNAADAMRDGGTLRVVLDSPCRGEVQVHIQDSGIGIAADQLKRIFEPFYTTKKRGEGTGLGLMAAKSIVDDHQGKLSVVSTLGEGTRFTILLPAFER